MSATPPRLTASFWVQAYLTRLRVMDIPAFVTSRGDDTAGAIIVKLNTLDGAARAYQRIYTADGNRLWAVLAQGSDADVEVELARQRQYDPDLWIIEVEDRAGRHLLEDEGLQ